LTKYYNKIDELFRKLVLLKLNRRKKRFNKANLIFVSGFYGSKGNKQNGIWAMAQ